MKIAGFCEELVCRDVAHLRGELARLGGIESLSFWLGLYVEGRATGNVFTDLFGRQRLQVK